MRRSGFTLVEILVASLIAIVVLTCVVHLLVSGSKLFASGLAAARGPEAAVILMDRLEEDVSRVIQAPGDPRPPMAISSDGVRLTFYRLNPDLSTAITVVGEPASWDLEPAGGGLSHPVIDGRPYPDILVGGWRFELLEPSREDELSGWFLAVEARFDTGRLLGSPYRLRRLIPLSQPTANFFHFPVHGGDLLEGVVQLLPRPPRDPSFERLGPATPVAPEPGEETPAPTPPPGGDPAAAKAGA